MNKKGVSLIEVLMVIAVFAILGILVSRVILITLRGSSKGDSLVNVRSAVDFSLAIIERQIRNAKEITTTPCEDEDGNKISYTRIDYVDANGSAGVFSCQMSAAQPYIASGSANLRLTGVNISVTSCNFTCTEAVGNTPPSVTVNVSAQNYGTTGTDTSSVTSSTTIYLRTY